MTTFGGRCPYLKDQLMIGSGTPVALQLNVTLESTTEILLFGCSANSGTTKHVMGGKNIKRTGLISINVFYKRLSFFFCGPQTIEDLTLKQTNRAK